MINRKVLAVLGMALASLVTSSAHATEVDQATKLTFSQSVQVPGRILPAGTYWFVADPGSGSNIVRILSEDQSTVYAALQTIPSERSDPPEGTAITLATLRSMQPEAIVTWFYPGRTTGHEFVYSKQDQKELATAKQYTVVAGKEVAQAKHRTVTAGQ
jgi:hypothetical protein